VQSGNRRRADIFFSKINPDSRQPRAPVLHLRLQIIRQLRCSDTPRMHPDRVRNNEFRRANPHPFVRQLREIK
jgi:hypothetical protein